MQLFVFFMAIGLVLATPLVPPRVCPDADLSAWATTCNGDRRTIPMDSARAAYQQVCADSVATPGCPNKYSASVKTAQANVNPGQQCGDEWKAKECEKLFRAVDKKCGPTVRVEDVFYLGSAKVACDGSVVEMAGKRGRGPEY